MKTRCAVEGCTEPATVEVLLYDVYHDGADRAYDVFMEQDFTCPYLCGAHWRENEDGCTMYAPQPERRRGIVSMAQLLAEPIPPQVPAGLSREYRGAYTYPFTNRNRAAGYSVYRPLDAEGR